MRKILLYTTAIVLALSTPALAGGYHDPAQNGYAAGGSKNSLNSMSNQSHGGGGIPWDELHDYIYGLGAAVSRAGGSGVTCGSCQSPAAPYPHARSKTTTATTGRRLPKRQVAKPAR